ncbi:LacI family DNA-binding transcriptional regulator [Nocardioides aquiterrae]|uniref:LacI family DNA-binding transcriptional regulator n=1 Tax=Nocardioides aquiterrae TaxID=203799 RepID=UPI0031DAB5AE
MATRAGVSPTTVSHVLSGKRVVGASTRDAVMDAIQELGYRPNHVARNLRTRQSHMIAVVVPDITNPFYAVLTRGLADAVDAAGYGSYVCNTDGQHERERTFFQDVMDRGVDGIVFASGETASEIQFGPADYSTPIICIGDWSASAGVAVAGYGGLPARGPRGSTVVVTVAKRASGHADDPANRDRQGRVQPICRWPSGEVHSQPRPGMRR